MKKLCIFMLLWSSGAVFAASPYVEYAIHKAAHKVGVPHKLLRAICAVESSMQAQALNESDAGLGNHAFGLCQLLYSTAAAYGVHDQRCLDNWKTNGKARIYANCKLWGPYTNALAAAKYLKYQMDRYDGNVIAATAAYNAGRVVKCPAKGYYKNRQKTIKFKCKPGGILNQNYIDKVDRALDRADAKWDQILKKVEQEYERRNRNES